MKERLIAILVSASITFTTISVPVFAEDTIDDTETISIETVSDNDVSVWDELSDEELAKISWSEYLRKYPNMDEHVGEDDPDSYTNNNLKYIYQDTDYFDYTADSIYPSKYDSRDYGLVTSVKNQGRYGTCWAFSNIAAMESSLIANGVANSSIDLSEAQLIYRIYLKYYSNNNFYDFLMYGHHFEYWGNNPVYESRAPYTDIKSGSENSYTLSDSVMNNYDFEGTNVYRAYYSNPNEVKALIKEFGGASTLFYSYYNKNGKIGYYNLNTNNQDLVYYVPDGSGSKTPNHGVEVVGWDDNFDKNKFGVTPPGNGAWLCKNSYGTNGTNGHGSGFFWISYYDTSIKESYVEVIDTQAKGYLPTDIYVNQTEFHTRVGKPITLKVSRVGGQHATFDVGGSYKLGNNYDMNIEKISDTEYKITPNRKNSFRDYHILPINLYLPSIYGDDTNKRTIKSLDVKIYVKDPKIEVGNVTNASYLNKMYNVTESGKINITTTDLNNPTITFKSEDESIITVDNNGNFTPVTYGAVNIIVTCTEDDFTQTIKVPMCVVSKGFNVTGKTEYQTCSNKETYIEIPITATTIEGFDVTNRLTISNESDGSINNGLLKLLYNGESTLKTYLCWFDGTTNHKVPYTVYIQKVNHTVNNDYNIVKANDGNSSIIYKKCSVCDEDCGYVCINSANYYINNGEVYVEGSMDEYNERNYLINSTYIPLTEGTDYTVNKETGYYQIVFTPNCKYYSGTINTYEVVPVSYTNDDPYNDNIPTEVPSNVDNSSYVTNVGNGDNNTPTNNNPILTNNVPTNTTTSTTDNSNSANNTSTSNGKNTSTSKSKKVTKTPKITVKSNKIKSIKCVKSKTAKITLNKKLDNIDGYVIKISTNKSMKSSRTITTYKTGKTINLKNLKAGTKYYVKVRAFAYNGDKKVYGPYSKTKSVTIKN